MNTKWKEIITLTFKGSRFDDHSIEIPFLSELIGYQNLVKHSTEIMWRLNNPDSKRLPRGFNELAILRFREIRADCVIIPLEAQDTSMKSDIFTSLEQSVNLLTKTIRSVNKNERLPDELPKAILPEIVNWGKKLVGDDSIYLKTPNGDDAFYSYSERRKIMKFVEGTYDEIVDIIGEVFEVNIKNHSFRIYAKDGSSIQAKFKPHQEDIITEALKKHRNLKLWVKGKAILKGVYHILDKITEIHDLQIISTEESNFNHNAQPIWEQILELSASIPEEEWDKLPKDGATNLDYYLYGGSQK